jgi:plasmid maintenance system antidote protein VapI
MNELSILQKFNIWFKTSKWPKNGPDFEKIMSEIESEIIPPIHPGQFIKEYILPQIIETNITDFTTSISVVHHRFLRILNCKESVDPALAVTFSIAFGKTAEYWIEKQRKFDNFQLEHNKEKLVKTELIKSYSYIVFPEDKNDAEEDNNR